MTCRIAVSPLAFSAKLAGPLLMRREIHTNQPLHKLLMGTKLERTEAKKKMIMQKLVTRSLERDKHKRPFQPTVTTGPWTADYIKEFEPRRVRVLQHLFLEHITELLATEEFTAALGGYSVDIIAIQYNRMYNQLNILWDSKGDAEHDLLIHNMLTAIAPQLRHDLSKQQVIGNLPRLVFLRDKTSVRMKELLQNIENADMGPINTDPVPEDAVEVTVHCSLENGISVKEPDADSLKLENLPLKRTDTGGLDRQALLDRLESGSHYSSKKRERA